MLSHRKVGAVTVAVFQDNVLDQSNARFAERLLTSLAVPGAKIVLDLGRAEWMDSSGCCTLITLLKRLKEAGGALKLCALTPPVRTLFELMRLHRIVDVYNTADEALRAFQG
jgi:anti-sigma B factor antagonist